MNGGAKAKKPPHPAIPKGLIPTHNKFAIATMDTWNFEPESRADGGQITKGRLGESSRLSQDFKSVRSGKSKPPNEAVSEISQKDGTNNA